MGIGDDVKEDSPSDRVPKGFQKLTKLPNGETIEVKSILVKNIEDANRTTESERKRIFKDKTIDVIIICVKALKKNKKQYIMSLYQEIRCSTNDTPVIVVLLDTEEIRFKNSQVM